MTGGTDWARRQRAARERWVEVPGRGYSVQIRVPDGIDIRRMERAGVDLDEGAVLGFVIDWRDVTEADVAPGVGGPEAVPFSPAAWREWIGSRDEDFAAISQAIADAIRERHERRAAIEGKSSGS